MVDFTWKGRRYRDRVAEPASEFIPVPKRTNIDAPDWMQVAMVGFQRWLRFWELETYREHPLANKLIELGMSVPPPVEAESLRNLELRARARFAPPKALRVLSPLERELFRLEREFMRNHQTEKFIHRYGRVGIENRFHWIGGRVGMGYRDVQSILNEVSLVLGEWVELEDAEVSIDELWRDIVKETMKEVA